MRLFAHAFVSTLELFLLIHNNCSKDRPAAPINSLAKTTALPTITTAACSVRKLRNAVTTTRTVRSRSALLRMNAHEDTTLPVNDEDTKKSNSDNDDDRYQRMLQWLVEEKGAMVSDSIELRPSVRGGGYGAFLTKDVPKDELLFAIPRTACVTLASALDEDTTVGPLLTKLVEKAGPGGNTVALAGFLAQQRLQGEESDYAPYLNTLPWKRGVNNQEHVLFWEDENVERLMQGSMCYGEAADLRGEVAIAIQVLNTILAKAEDAGSGFVLPWLKKDEPVKKPLDGLPEAVKGAFVCLLTRSFEDQNDDSSGDEEKLVPLLDMLQHADDPNISHTMLKNDKSVQVRARRSLEAGEELLNQYRSELEETMPYHRFFTRFGFVPGIYNDETDPYPIEKLLKDKSSIFFAQKAEV